MKSIFFIFFLAFTGILHAQSDSVRHGKINLERTGQLSGIRFDDVNYRLVAVDQYGNILDTAVVEFTMSVTIKGIFYSENAVGYGLTYQMQQLLGRADRTSRILFENIKAKDRNGTIVKMPAIRYTFGYSDENND